MKPIDCGTKVDCLVLPVGCTNTCHTVHSYLYNVKTKKVEIISQTLRDWTGFGFNNRPGMVRAKLNEF